MTERQSILKENSIIRAYFRQFGKIGIYNYYYNDLHKSKRTRRRVFKTYGIPSSSVLAVLKGLMALLESHGFEGWELYWCKKGDVWNGIKKYSAVAPKPIAPKAPELRVSSITVDGKTYQLVAAGK